MLLLIDNYDSFTWNLVQRFGEIDPSLKVEVIRNDAIDAHGALALAPTHLVISPGPCTPKESGACPAIINASPCRQLQVDGLPVAPVTVHCGLPPGNPLSTAFLPDAADFATVPSPASAVARATALQQELLNMMMSRRYPGQRTGRAL